MKKYIVIHDTTLLGESTIPGISGINAVDAGYGRGTVLYGNIVQKYRVGVGYQNFLQISTRDKFNGLYVPITAVAEIPISLTDSGSPVLQSGRLASSSSNESNNEVDSVSTQNGTTEPVTRPDQAKKSWLSDASPMLIFLLVALVIVVIYRYAKIGK